MTAEQQTNDRQDSKIRKDFPFTVIRYLLSVILFKSFVVLVGAAEEHCESQVSGLDIVVALGVFAFDPDADGDLLGSHGVEMEHAGIIIKGIGYVEGGLAGYGGALVGLIDGGGAGNALILKGHAQTVDYVGLDAGLGRSNGGSGLFVTDLDRLAGEVDVHLLGGDEPNLELHICIGVGGTGDAVLREEVDAVGGGYGIEKLLLDIGGVDRGEICIDHLVGEGLLPQGEILCAAILDIQEQLGGCGDIEGDVVDIGEVAESEPRESGGDQHQHGNDAEQEGGAPLDAGLGLLELIQFLAQLDQKLLLIVLFFHTTHQLT